MKNFSFLILGFTFLLSSCKEDITASWLKIDTINLETNSTTEGINSHDITDAWVYLDNQPIGVFELPCEIPILEEGVHDFSIRPGIKSNGINSTRTWYPFYTWDDFSLELIKGKTVSYTPTVTYKSGIEFIGREDFEDTGIILAPINAEDTTKISIISKNNYPNIVKYGDNCGRMSINSIDSIISAFTNLTLEIPAGKTYMELDYLNTNTFAIGMISQTLTTYTRNEPFIRINSQEAGDAVWKKIYLDLTDYVSYLSNPLYFEYYLVSALDSDKSAGDIYIDNIKILYFN
jgi:hypothetical protein